MAHMVLQNQTSVPLPAPEQAQENPDEPPGCRSKCEILTPAAPLRFSGKRDAAMLIRLPKPRAYASNPKTKAFRKQFYTDIPDKLWNDWSWQVTHRLRSREQLARMLRLSETEAAALSLESGGLPVSVTPYYLSLLSTEDSGHALRRTVIPTLDEHRKVPEEADDPLGEDHQSPVPGLVHRYPDRVLFLALDFCSTYCRYCTRSRVVGRGQLLPSRTRWEKAIEYIRQTPSIRDVLISGGDPLLMSDDRLNWLLTRLRQIPHVEIIRIGTKVPAVLPQRITPQLTRMLRRHHPLWMSLHFTHPEECTAESYRACGLLADAGIPLGSQTVLLKGVNDSVETMTALMHQLMRMRVRPYYLYQCDPISGSAHFRTTVEKGLDIIRGMRGFTTGYAVPTYVVDSPGGGGKIPLCPEYVVERRGSELLLKNFEGNLYRHADPCDCVAEPVMER